MGANVKNRETIIRGMQEKLKEHVSLCPDPPSCSALLCVLQ